MKKFSGFMTVLFIIIATGFLTGFPQKPEETRTVKIFGRVTDFKGQAVVGATVELKDARFSNAAMTNSGPDGRYSLVVPKGHYMALTAVKGYQVQSLEYWAWNVPADRDLEINPRFDRLEVYAINAWRPQGAYPSYQIYFRPMSLSAVVKKVTEAGGMEKFRILPVMDIAPELGKKDITVVIDGQNVNVLELNKVREASGLDQSMFGYLIQVTLPEKTTQRDYSVITITLTDPVTGEKGEGCLFFRRKEQP
ncbi:MAG: carboxypeptidase regulatory-like domain-containing protein [Candidatus Aminicenantales bacterium]